MNRLPMLVVCLLFGAATQVHSQQLSLFSQYRENQTIINPAAVGGNYLAYGQNLSFGATYRNQWAGFEGSPKTAILRGEYLWNNGGAVSLLSGGYLVNDQTGPTGYTGLYGRVGGLLSEDPYYGGIAVGLSFGAVQYRVDVTKIRLRETNDVLGMDDQRKVNPDVGVGVFAYKMLEGGGFFDGDYVYGGFSVPQAIGFDVVYETEDGDFAAQRIQHYYVQAGLYKFFRDGDFLEPSVWVKYAANVPLNVDFNLRYQMAENFWAGIGGSTAQSSHIEVGVLLGENIGFDHTLKIGYGLDYHFTQYGPYTGASHEINVSYSLDNQ